MNDIETYKGNINEFVDWVTGKNVLDDSNVTNGLPVSGGSIRKLLQDKLKKPLYMYEDIENGVYRMFSSEDSKNLYLSDVEQYKDLELFNFVRPSDYELSTNISLNPRYIISGNSNLATSKLIYNWSIKKGTSSASDSISANYTITDENGNIQKFSKLYSSTQTQVTIDLYPYLTNGNNTISVELKGNSTGATCSVSFIIVVLTLELESSFAFNNKHVVGDNLTIPYTLKRNVTSVASAIKCCVDGELVKKIDIPANGGGAIINNSFNIVNSFSEGKHNLQLWVELQYDTTIFKSDVIYFEFVTASSSPALNYFLNIKRYLKDVLPPVGTMVLTATLYEGISLLWGYYTDNIQTDTSINVIWKLELGEEKTIVGQIKADKYKLADDLVFSPTIYSTEDNPINLVGYFGDKVLVTIPMSIAKSTLTMYETSNYDLKFTAYGKTNNGNDYNIWQDESKKINAVFNGIEWNAVNGWYENSFRTLGTNSYATIDYKTFSGNPSNGRTIEFEFETEKINDDDDIVIKIGNDNSSRIEVTPNSASLYDSSNNKIIYTNYKNNERIKLAFIINPETTTTDSLLIYIINNGVLERAVSGTGIIFNNDGGNIKIGGSASGIKFYSIRCYNRAISYTDAYNNYVFDNDDKVNVITANNVIKDGVLNYDLCVNKVDTILISGDLTNILNQKTDKDGSVTDVTIERICPFDSTKNFKCINCQIRKHGQSTLNYPITSMKFWLNKNSKGEPVIFSCPGLLSLLLSKNRYKMKNTSIPANKFVLQANYADSSGVSNGGLERLIQSTWYNATIDGEYKLRTEPQLFSSNNKITHNNISDLNEDSSVTGYNADGKQWKDYFEEDFPYQIEVAPDSFPCVVFYQDTNKDNTKKYLGQYVFMEDKKSDFCYGERSIYKASRKDPYCLTITNKDGDTADNKIWDNEKVLRMEVLAVNSLFSSYLSSDDLNQIIYDNNNQPASYKFEEAFELIYPDPDDVAGNAAKGTDKFGTNSKYIKTVTPFLDFVKWIVSTKNNHLKFQLEASKHLDLYKMAAYYIMCMRFGLVDSMERNAQIKTYDGIHFHYEPWDMDISMGKKNTGGIAFQPPMDRNTTLPGDATTYAFSGRAGLPGSSTYTSNWLWDALEGWDYWANTIVPKVSQALYMAGLNYNTFTTLFDKDYAAKWCEIMYNESCHFKYVDSRGGNNAWLAWLQGSGTPYRHWWTSISNDYYNAKWSCGEFKNHYVYIAGVKEAKDRDGIDMITITPFNKTYFTIAKNYDNNLLTTFASKDEPAVFDASKHAFSTKEPFVIYGANNIEKLDISCFATGIDTIGLAGAYSEVLGPCIKELNIGSRVEKINDNQYKGTVNGGTTFSISTGENDALGALQTISVRGQQPLTSWDEFYTKNRTLLQNVYAMGSGLTNFYSAKNGNIFNKLELPGVTKDSDGNVVKSLAYMLLTDTTWESIEFWDTTLPSSNNIATFNRCNINGDYSLNTPTSLKHIELLGTSASNQNSLNFVLNWIDCIEKSGDDLSKYELKMNQVDWSNNTCTTLLTYEQLSKLAQLNGGRNDVEAGTYKGYIVLETNGEHLTAQQLTLIKSWFGDSCFNKNSAGLVIDHALNYILINVGSNAFIEGGNIYLNENNRASLNATRFSLGEDSGEYSWYIKGVSDIDSSFVYKSCSLQKGEDGIMYLYADESAFEDYQVLITCTSLSFESSVIVNIVTVKYPQQCEILLSNNKIKLNEGVYYFLKEGLSSEFYLNIKDAYTATLTDVKFSISDSNGNVLLLDTSYKSLCINDGALNTLDELIGYTKNAKQLYSINIYNSSVSENITEYTLTSTLCFKYVAKKIKLQNKITIIDDAIVLVPNDGSFLYKVCNANYKAKYGHNLESGNFYRIDLMALTDTFDFTIDDGAYLTLQSIKVYNNRSLLHYLPKVKYLVINNVAILETNQNITDDDKRQFVFDDMVSLKKVSFKGNTVITNDIDLTKNDSLEEVNTQDTNVNVILPSNSRLNKIDYGSPTKINILNPSILAVSNVTIQDSSNVVSVELANIPNNCTFTLLNKLIS